MKLLPKLSLLVCMALFSLSCLPESVDDSSDLEMENMVVPKTKEIEVEILELINDHRLSKGLTSLKDMSIIKSTAFSHTSYMVGLKEVSHHNFYSRSNYLKSNAGAKKVSENVAFGFTSAESVVKAWLRSERHRKNLEGDFTDFEVSAEKDADGRWYYTNIFIKK